MSGSFHGINLAGTALRGFQRAMDVAGNNIANVNTPGYSRQRVEFANMQPIPFYSNGRFTLGQGVTISALTRARDQFLDARMRDVQGNLSRNETLTGAMQGIEGVFGEPSEEGISSALNGLFNAWSALGSRPDDPSARMQVRQAGLVLTDRVRGAYSQLTSQAADLSAQTGTAISRVNELAGQIAQLNNEIRQSGSASPNDLMDQRDRLVQELGGLVDTRVSRFQDGSYAVYAAGFTLVDSAGARPFPSTVDVANGTVTDGTNTFRIGGGQLAGLIQGQRAIAGRQAQLDQLANTMKSTFNTMHVTGTTANGTTGVNFFADAAPQTGAIDFRLSDDVTASADNIAAGISGRPGDGGLALAFSDLRESANAALGNQSFTRFFDGMVNGMATDAAYWSQAADTSRSLAAQTENQIQSVSGVNIDDEMADMMRYQRSFQAAAKALTVFDQMTEDLIGMLRR